MQVQQGSRSCCNSWHKVKPSCTFTVHRRCEDGCPVVRVNAPGLLQQSHVWYCWRIDAAASSGSERRCTSDHRRSTARLHIACSPAAALATSPPTSSVQAGCASVQSTAWASSTVLDGRLSTHYRCQSPSTTIIWRRHMFSATDPHVPWRSCVWCCRTTSVERFADHTPSASPLPWTVPTVTKKAFIWLCVTIAEFDSGQVPSLDRVTTGVGSATGAETEKLNPLGISLWPSWLGLLVSIALLSNTGLHATTTSSNW